jgi:hypothetical protein
MKSLLLGPAILMALVVAAAAEPYVCRGGTTVELSAQKGKVVSYTVLHADPRNTFDHRVQITRDRYGSAYRAA